MEQGTSAAGKPCNIHRTRLTTETETSVPGNSLDFFKGLGLGIRVREKSLDFFKGLGLGIRVPGKSLDFFNGLGLGIRVSGKSLDFFKGSGFRVWGVVFFPPS